MPVSGPIHTIRPGLAESIKKGRAVPIISDEVLFDLVLGGHADFVDQYANHVDYPMEDRHNLPRIAKYRKLAKQAEERKKGRNFTDNDLRVDYLKFVKRMIYCRAKSEGVDDDLLADAVDADTLMSVTDFAQQLGYPVLKGGQQNPLLVLANLPFERILTTSPFRFIETALRFAGKEPRTAVCRWRKDLRHHQ